MERVDTEGQVATAKVIVYMLTCLFEFICLCITFDS